MPHKHNPIQSERVCGLARVARGHFSAIAESTALWEDRDLTNSAVERTAVPDLAATVEYMTTEMIAILSNLEVDAARMQANLDAHPEAWSSIFQGLAQVYFNMGPIEAARFVRKAAMFHAFGAALTVRIDFMSWEYPLAGECKTGYLQAVSKYTGLTVREYPQF